MLITILAWSIVFLMGFALIQVCCYALKPVEKFGFAMPVGIGLSSIYMFILDLVGIPVNSKTALLAGQMIIIVVLLFLTKRKHGNVLPSRPDILQSLEFPHRDMAYYLALAGILAMLIVIGIKSVIWPIVSYDAVTGYDMLAKIIAVEGTFDNSVFDKANSLETHRTGYPPLYPYALTYARLFGPVNPQVTCLFWYVPMAICFYGLLRHYLTPLGSAVFTLLLISTPDYADFSSISSNNTPLAFYSGLGMIAIYIWYDKQIRSYFTLGMILIALGSWDRLEGVFFFVGAAILVFIHCWQSRKFQPLLMFLVICLLPTIVWQIYSSEILEVSFKREVRLMPFWDAERFRSLVDEVEKVTFSTFYYGIVIFLSLVMIGLHLVLAFFTKQKKHWLLIACIAIAWLGYVALFYQMKTEFVSNALISASYKRGLYSYLPPLIFGVSLLFLSQYAFGHQSIFRTVRDKANSNQKGPGSKS